MSIMRSGIGTPSIPVSEKTCSICLKPSVSKKRFWTRNILLSFLFFPLPTVQQFNSSTVQLTLVLLFRVGGSTVQLTFRHSLTHSWSRSVVLAMHFHLPWPVV